MVGALAWFLVMALFALAPVWMVSGLVGIYHWWRGDTRVPRAVLRDGRPRLRPGLAAPLALLVLGSALVACFVWVAWVIHGCGRRC